MEVDDTAETLTRSFIKSIRPVFKSTFAEDENTLTERVHKIVQNAEEVCCNSVILRPEYDTIILPAHVRFEM